jgi:hypothetical protein
LKCDASKNTEKYCKYQYSTAVMYLVNSYKEESMHDFNKISVTGVAVLEDFSGATPAAAIGRRMGGKATLISL